MRKWKKLKSTLAILTAAVVVFTGPAQSMVGVQAVEQSEDATILDAIENDRHTEERAEDSQEEHSTAQETEIEVYSELNTKTEAETQMQTEVNTETETQMQTEVNTETETQVQSETETQMQTESNTETETDVIISSEQSESEESDSESSTEVISSEEIDTEFTEIVEETALNEETSIETEIQTQEATKETIEEESKQLGQEIQNAIPLSIGKNQSFVIKQGEECQWYSYTPDESGVYSVYLNRVYLIEDDIESYVWDCGDLSIRGQYRSLMNYQYILEAGKTVYFQPYIYGYVWEEEELDQIAGMLRISKLPKGIVTVNNQNEGKYTLSYSYWDEAEGVEDETRWGMCIDASYTAIYFSLEFEENEDEEYYSLYAYCDDCGYGGSESITGLDMGTKHHLSYYILINDEEFGQRVFLGFEGTGMPFDVFTKHTDKEGGVINNATADDMSITIEYELFSDDTGGNGGYIRYRKKSEEAWYYEGVSSSENSLTIAVDGGTDYVIELVSWNKKMVYDSIEIATRQYTGTITATVKENTVTANEALIDIQGYDTTIGSLCVEVEYTDSFGEEQKLSNSYGREDIQSGIVTFPLYYLEAGTEYRDVKIKVYDAWYNWSDRLIYTTKVNFTTKESPIKKENIRITDASVDPQTADVKFKINEIPSGTSIKGYLKYRRKGEYEFSSNDYFEMAEGENTYVHTLSDLSAYTDYELRYNINGVAGIYEFCYIPEFTVKILPKINVINTYVNGLEVECILKGAADSEDTYTCEFEVYDNDGYWERVNPHKITLDSTKPVRNQIYSSKVRPGQKQRWRYTVYQNNLEYYIGGFLIETKPLEMEILSITNSSDSIDFIYKIHNWEDIIKNEDSKTFIDAGFQIRKKGEEQWKDVYKKYDNGKSIYLTEGTERLQLSLRNEPFAQYELRIVSYGEDSIIYGSKSFTTKSGWSTSDKVNLIYTKEMGHKSYISLYDNFEKPTVEVENENIVSVQEIRRSRIYFDVHTTGTTKVHITADKMTKTVQVTASVDEQFFYLEGADTSLADIELPENFKWADSAISPKADNNNKIQYFDVKIQEGDAVKYGSIPVAVGRLDDINIQGSDMIGSGKEGLYSAFYQSIGHSVTYYGEGKAYKTSQKWTVDKNLKIIGKDTERNVTIAGGNTAGTYDLCLELTIENIRSGKTITVTKRKPVRVIGAGLIDNLIIQPAKEQPEDVVPYVVGGSIVSGTIIEVDYDSYDHDKKSKVQLEAKTDTGSKSDTGETLIKGVSVNWKNQSTDILDVTDSGLVTIKNKGEGKILANAKDEGNFFVPVFFKIYDSSPVFENTFLTVNQGTDGTILAFREQNRNSVTDIKVAEPKSQLEVVQYADKPFDWYLRTKRQSRYAEEQTEQVTLEISTQKKKYFQPLTVTVMPEPEADADTVIFKQTIKPNLFYVDSEAVFSVNSNYEIEDIKTIAADENTMNFHVKNYNSRTGLLTLTANKLSKETIGAYTKKNSLNAVANIEVKFKDYKEPVVYYNIKVAVVNKAVSLKAEDAVVAGTSENSLVNVLSGKNIFDISGSSIEIKSVSPSKQKGNFQPEVCDSQLRLTYKGTGSAKYRLIVKNTNWTKDITLSGKISKVDITKLVLKASRTKAIMNTGYSEEVQEDFYIKGNNGLAVTLNYEIKPKTDKLNVILEDQTIIVKAVEGKIPEPAKYTIKVWGETGGQRTKTTKFVITVTDKIPTIKLSAKGSINIANRDMTGITYTASVKNTDANISKVEIMDVNALRFSVKKDDSKKITLKALRNVSDIKKNTKYTINLNITLSNNCVLPVTVNVKPVNKLPKIKIKAPTNPIIDRNTKKSIPINLTYDKGYHISEVKLTGNNSEDFTITMNGQNRVMIGVPRNSNELKPKKYTLKYQIYITGADNTKPITKSIKITVK